MTALLPEILPDAAWRHRPGLDSLLAALGEGQARFVGGAVRDTLLGIAVNDVDIATVHAPATVIERLKAAGIKTVPTGIDHGTVTAVLDGWPVEITTLRRDVSTDGRRATIAFTDDWREDAARRDFTINALYADPASGAITDYFGGLADLAARHVRFIGSAADRIAEDHLRILRFFRFFARFGSDDPDVDAYAACVVAANSLMALSRERIADELLKLLALPHPMTALTLMIDGEIWRPVLPEIDTAGLDRLRHLMAREAASDIAPSAARRLAALVPADPQVADAICARLKLSNRIRKRLAIALGPVPDGATLEAVAYRIGAEGAIDRALLGDGDVAPLAALQQWQKPALSLSGGALIQRGLTPGPDVAKALHALEAQWIKEGFPDADRTGAIADQIVSKFQRARQ